MTKLFRLLPVMLAAAALAGCETTGSGVGPVATAAPPPMTRIKAAEICWMATEHGHNDMDLDKRADVVDKCIDEKMGGHGAPKS